MQVDTFFTLSDEFLQECKDIQIEKGREYTIDDGSRKVDKFANFRSIGARLNLDPKIVMLVYMLKHMDSLRTYALYEQEGSEGVKGRCQDLVNYAVMFWAMDHEDKAFAELLEDDVPELNIESIIEHWASIMEKIHLVRPSIGAIMEECQPTILIGNTLIINATSSGIFSVKIVERSIPTIEKLISDEMDSPIKVRFLNNGEDTKSHKKKPNIHPNDNKLFKKMVELFDNEILR